MSVSRDDVLAVAKLARLRLSAQEIERLTEQLNSILDHMDELRGVPLAGVPAMGGAAEGAAPLRDDVPAADPLAQPPAAFAAAWQDGFFTVPRLAALDADATESRAP
jgi:aspartyl-tRNA(Asn)/glutamyl-tRNA(Gln) amidotransferase subunit C